jgi:RNA-directed DNA polymerase
MPGGSRVNIRDLEADPAVWQAEQRVLEIQAKLHHWAVSDPHRVFDDVFNLVCDAAFLRVAWYRVRNNRGGKTAGVDGKSAWDIERDMGLEEFLARLREDLKGCAFRPLPVRERMIPKPGTSKKRRLGIPVIRDRVVQAALKLVLEPVFEAGFLPCSYGFRPNRRAHDAVAEVHYLASRNRDYEWVVEGDIKACFDEISHPALLARVQARIGDKRVLALVKAFLKAGIMREDGTLEDTGTGTPQGAILSPLLANVALSVLDEHIASKPGGPASTPSARAHRRRTGLPNFRLIRYADDWCLMVKGTKADAGALREEIAGVLATMGLRLSEEKTLITHIDEGLDFLGWRIQRHRKRGTQQQYVYTYPARKALKAVMAKVKAICCLNTGFPLEVLLHRLNPVLRGWTAYFRPGVSSATFQYLRAYTWQQVIAWIRRKHRRMNWKEFRRRYCAGGWWPADGDVTLFNPGGVHTTRYRYRGTAIPSPWPQQA